MHPPARSLHRRAFRTSVLGGIASTTLLAVLPWAGVSSLRQALNRIEIDPGAFNPMFHGSVLSIFREGTPQRKRDPIAAILDAPAESITFDRPQLEDAAKDADPEVGRASRQAFGRIDPAKDAP